MPTQFVFKKGYFNFQAEFARPALDLLSQPVAQKLAEELLTRLGPAHGMRISHLKINHGDGDLGRANLGCSLFDFNAVLRIGLERLELETYYVERIGRETLSQGTLNAAQAMIAVAGKNPFSTWMVDLGLHGQLPGTTPKVFIGKFQKSQPSIGGALTGSACSFYFGPLKERLSCLIGLDMSAVVEDGLFFRKRTLWDAAALPVEAFPERASADLDSALADLGLSLESE